MNAKEYIDNARDSTMNHKEFVDFISEVYKMVGCSYTLASQALNGSAPTIRRVVNGQDSSVLRKILHIKKSDRTRI